MLARIARTLVGLSAHAAGANPGQITAPVRPLAASGRVRSTETAPASAFRCAGLSSRAGREADRSLEACLALRLTPCQWSILRLLLAHPLLSDDELAAFLDLQRKSVRCSLYGLHQLDCLQSIPTVVGKRWQLCERGLRLLATANHLPLRTL